MRGTDIFESYVSCQIKALENSGKQKARTVCPFVTISRQAGAGGITIGEKLVADLWENDKEAVCPWAIFDKTLVNRVLEDHQLPDKISEYMAERKVSQVDDIMEELFNLHPSEWTLVHKTSETILNLAQMGNVILVGRGSHIITKRLENGFHVRLIASPEKRVEHLQEYYKLDRKKALKFMEKEDKGRRDYVKEHFDQNIDDPLGYDLVINTDRFSYDHTAKLIAHEVLEIRKKINL